MADAAIVWHRLIGKTAVYPPVGCSNHPSSTKVISYRFKGFLYRIVPCKVREDIGGKNGVMTVPSAVSKISNAPTSPQPGSTPGAPQLFYYHIFKMFS